MLLEAAHEFAAPSPWGHGPAAVVALPAVTWSVIVPFFNERDYLDRTIESLAAQTHRFTLILVDNGSTDGSAAVAALACQRSGLGYTLIVERTPGKVAALAAGLALVRTPFVATCDADTWYPADYLAQAEALLDRRGSAAAGAWFACADDRARRRRKALHASVMPHLLRRQCHSGGAGQVFRTAALRRAGGFCAGRWNWVLEDHEIVHRVAGEGAVRYGARFWCSPAPRERDRASIRWTLFERIVYHAAAPIAGDWFFYRFLARRLTARKLSSERIRERPFQGSFGSADAPPRSVCG